MKFPLCRENFLGVQGPVAHSLKYLAGSLRRKGEPSEQLCQERWYVDKVGFQILEELTVANLAVCNEGQVQHGLECNPLCMINTTEQPSST